MYNDLLERYKNINFNTLVFNSGRTFPLKKVLETENKNWFQNNSTIFIYLFSFYGDFLFHSFRIISEWLNTESSHVKWSIKLGYKISSDKRK